MYPTLGLAGPFDLHFVYLHIRTWKAGFPLLVSKKIDGSQVASPVLDPMARKVLWGPLALESSLFPLYYTAWPCPTQPASTGWSSGDSRTEGVEQMTGF